MEPHKSVKTEPSCPGEVRATSLKRRFKLSDGKCKSAGWGWGTKSGMEVALGDWKEIAWPVQVAEEKVARAWLESGVRNAAGGSARHCKSKSLIPRVSNYQGVNK